ncbi:MAG: ATP-dependent zinc protease family protein [Acidimicrobiia bacterium]
MNAGAPRPSRPPLPVVGWREWVALPDLGVDWVKAKVDTGARSSSLHAWAVSDLGDGRLRFQLHPFQDDDATAVSTEAALLGHREVRSSNGDAEVRPVIRTTVVVLGVPVDAELSLTRRDEMGFRMLLGRRAIRRRFLVDPGRSFRGGGDRVSPPAPGPRPDR